MWEIPTATPTSILVTKLRLYSTDSTKESGDRKKITDSKMTSSAAKNGEILR